MKKTTKIFGLLLTLFGLALVTGCTPITDTPEVPGETTYTVTIASGITNGTVSTDKTSAKAGETVKLTVTPNDGYKLENLIVVDSSANPIPTTSNTFTMPESNVTVDATFSEIPKVEYTVTYSSEYGTAPASITVTENTVLTAEQLPELSTEGKTFGGWFDGDTKAEAGKYKVTKTVTLTAKWDVNTYTVTFNTNEGNSVESKTVTYGGKVEKPADPTKAEIDTERYSFAYWYTSDKPDSAFDFNTEIKADITLYAKWNTTALYSITIASGIANGTVSTDKTDKIAAGETITLTVTPNDGYEFDIPSVKNGDIDITITQDSSDVTKYTFTMPAGNVTISARFVIKTYTVTFKDGDTVVSTQPIEHGKTVIKPGDPTKAETDIARYSFAYWYTLNNNVETEFNFNTEIISDITLYAKWTEFRKYKVEYYWWNSSTEYGLIEYTTEALDIKLELEDGRLNSKLKSDEEWNLFFSEKLPEIYGDDNTECFYAICDGNCDIYKFKKCEISDNTIKLYYHLSLQDSSTNALYLY